MTTLPITPQSQAAQDAAEYVRIAQAEAANIPGIPVDTPTRPIHEVAVVGAGTMGVALPWPSPISAFPSP